MALKINTEEYEKIVLELAKKGMTSEQIGLILKKDYKIPPRNFGKIGRILKKHNIPNSPDIENLKKSVQKLQKHASSHKKDKTFKRALLIKSAKLRKLQNI